MIADNVVQGQDPIALFSIKASRIWTFFGVLLWTFFGLFGGAQEGMGLLVLAEADPAEIHH